MNRDTILGILRHLLTTAGGALTAKGYASSSETEGLIGAIITIVGVLWSMWSKRKPPAGGDSTTVTPTVLLVLGLLGGLGVGVTGCQSPEAASFKTIASVQATVKTALSAWADYVVAQRAALEKLPMDERLGPSTELTKAEGRVEKSLGDYKAAMAAAEKGVNASLDAGVAPAPSALIAAASAFVSAVESGRLR